jgi:hypothetical protein
MTGFYTVAVNSMWGTAPFSSFAPEFSFGGNGGYQADVKGGEVFYADATTRAVHMLDLSTPAFPVDLGLARSPYLNATVNSVVVNGNLMSMSQTYQVSVLELATPMGMRQFKRGTVGWSTHELSGAFLYGPEVIHDLQGTSSELFSGDCVYGMAVVDDWVVSGAGPQLIISNLEPENDRNAATVFGGANHTVLAMPAGVQAMGMKAWGNHLFVAEQRSDGTYLEVFTTRKIRDRLASTTFDPVADSLGALKVSSVLGRADVALNAGRAFVFIEGAGGTVTAVDARPLLDDDASTGLTAASLQGTVTPAHPAQGVSSAVVQGNTLLMTTADSLEVVDVTAAMDNSPSTLIPAAPVRGELSVYQAQAVAVSGAYAVVTGGFFTMSVDVSTLTTPKTVVQLGTGMAWPQCYISSTALTMHPGISIHGSRAYATAYNQLIIYDLE